MALSKEQKKEILKELKEKLEKQKAIVFVDFQNLGTRDLFDLRKRLQENNCQLKIAKRTLVNLAFEEKKLKVDFEKMEGQLALVFSFGNTIIPAKIVYDFSEELGVPKILGGYIENEFLEAEKVIELAKLPSKEKLLAKLVRTLRAPISNFQMLLQQPLQRLTYALRAVK